MFPLRSVEKELSLVPKVNGMNCPLGVLVFFHQFKTKQDESTPDYRNDWLRTTGFQVIGEDIKRKGLKPTDTLSCSQSCWAFLGNYFNAGSSLCGARGQAHAKWKYSKRLVGRHKGMYCGIQHKRQAEDIWSMPWKNVRGSWTMRSWSARALTGRKERAAVCVRLKHPEPPGDQEEVWYVAAGELGALGHARGSGGCQPFHRARPTQLPLRPAPACSEQALLGNSSRPEKNIVL